jgi:hypothetical protein
MEAFGPTRILRASKTGVSLIAIKSRRAVHRACPLGPVFVVK